VSNQVSVCYLTFDSLLEGVGQSQIVPLLKGLNKNGFKIFVVSFEKNLDCHVNPFLHHPGIIWKQLPFGAHGFAGLPLRILRMTNSLPKADIYHSRSDLPVLALALRRKKRFLWDVRSLWYDQKALIENRKRSGFTYSIFRKIEKYVAKRAAAINVLASALLPVLIKRNNILPKIQIVVPTSVDLKKFEFMENFPDQKKILLSGSLNNFYDMDRTLEILDFLNARGFDVRWMRPKESLRNEIKRIYIEIESASYEDMSTQVSLSSFGIAICRDDEKDVLKGVMPTKIAEFLAVGRPVLVSPGMGDLDSLIQSTKTGVIVSRNMELKEIYDRVNELIEDKGTPERCRKLAENHFSMENAIKTYKETYLNMLAED
jgi:glycosyltransferase involved in cell wall biosynthesis